MDFPEFKDLTPEQLKEVSDALSKARRTMLFATVKFVIGLFAANLFTIFVGHYFLKDTNPDMQTGFRFLTCLVNTFFLVKYLDGKFKQSSDIVAMKIKEVLKK